MVKLTPRQRRVWNGFNLVARAFRHEVRHHWIGRYLPPLPLVLRLQGGDAFSLAQAAPETSLTKLRHVLATPAFRAIRQVEIDGTESALRLNLLEIGQILIASLPALTDVISIIPGEQGAAVIEHINALIPLQSASIALRVCIVFDSHFSPVADMVELLKQRSIPISVRCTLTPQNCYEADDVLMWCEQQQIRDVAFRAALDKEFTSEQRFHLTMFFDKLLRRPGISLARRAFYQSLVDQMAFGLLRHRVSDGQRITVDLQGNIDPAQHQEVQYGGSEPSVAFIARRALNVVEELYQQRQQTRMPVGTQSITRAEHDAPRKWKQVLITGWYGTETTGDKAILAEVLHFLKAHSPDCKIILTTIDPKVSQQTEHELSDLRGSVVVNIARAHEPSLIETVDAVIIGGGPLMETQQMESVWRIFAEANRQRKARIVFGCGVGPLRTERMLALTTSVLRIATAGFLRDQESHELATKLAPGNPLYYACDPSLAYLQRWKAHYVNPASSDPLQAQIAGLLRANTREFIADTNQAGLVTLNDTAAQTIARMLESVCKQYPANTCLLSMNAHWLGGDDRLFNRQVAGFFDAKERVQVERKYLPLDALVGTLARADAAIAMRYHGHLFCIALGIPFVSIDYTGRAGKVSSLVRRIGYEQWSQEWRTIDAAHSVGRLQQLLDERTHWSMYLQQQSEKLVTELHQTYQRVFDLQTESRQALDEKNP